jgi:toxin-antitoxin system PIN domain toxin
MPSFPDINVWLALANDEHVHHHIAIEWWQHQDEPILFCRLSQLGLLRLLTTSAIMGGKPLSMQLAWRIYDGLMADDRVQFCEEPTVLLEHRFRDLSSHAHSSPKAWADYYFAAFSEVSGSTLVTFDRAMAKRAADALLLA